MTINLKYVDGDIVLQGAYDLPPSEVDSKIAAAIAGLANGEDVISEQDVDARIYGAFSAYPNSKPNFIDPFFTRMALGQDLDNADRWNRGLTDLSISNGSIFGGKSLVVNGNSSLLGGPIFRYEDFGEALQAGDVITILGVITSSGSPTARFVGRQVNAASSFVGNQSTADAKVATDSPQTFSARVVVEVSAIGFQLYPYRSSGTGTFSIHALWAYKGELASAPPLPLFTSAPASNSVSAQVKSRKSVHKLDLFRSTYLSGNSWGIFGDSWSDPDIRIRGPLAALIDADIGIATEGYISANIRGDRPGAATRSRSGSWTDTTANGQGLDAEHSTGSAGAAMTVTATNATGWTIQYFRKSGGGDFTWSVDGGSATTVSAAGASSLISLNVVGASLTINVTSGSVDFAALISTTNAVGMTLQKIANSGGDLARLLSVSAANFQSALAGVPLDGAIIEFGINDRSYNTPIETYKANLRAVIARLKLSNPSLKALILGPADAYLAGAERLHTTEEYNQAAYDVAFEDGHSFISLLDALGAYAQCWARGIYGDDAHINAAGGLEVGKILFRAAKA